VTKVVDLSGVINPSGIDETFTVTVTGPSYPAGITHDFVVIDGVLQAPATWTLTNLIPGVYTISEADAGTEWTEVVTGSPATVVAGQTASSTVTNTYVPREGFTPGFWKNHPEEWAETGYTTGQTLESVFDIPDDFGLDNFTLLQALSFQGGKGKQGAAQNLLRAAVAALLNASHPDVDYPLTTAQVISQVNAALAGSRNDMDTLQKQLNAYNNLGGTI
jgi:hypothetical protein